MLGQRSNGHAVAHAFSKNFRRRDEVGLNICIAKAAQVILINDYSADIARELMRRISTIALGKSGAGMDGSPTQKTTRSRSVWAANTC